MDELVKRINESNFKGGTLKFFGEWFGRPYDNFHRFVEASSEGNCLLLKFDGNDLVRIWDPQEIVIEKYLTIKSASRVEFRNKTHVFRDDVLAVEVLNY